MIHKQEVKTHFNKSGLQMAWDSTSLKLAYECPRKYYYKMIQDWEDSLKSVHLIFGGHYARALETYHKLVTKDGLTHDEATLAVVRQTLIESWIHNLTKDTLERIPGTGHPQEFLHTAKTRENLIRTIIWYLEEFKESDFETYIKADGTPAVEFSFKLEVDANIVLCGHVDRLLAHGRDIFVQDQKTTGTTVAPYYFENYDLDIQMSMYTFAGKAIYNIPVKGVMIDAAQIAVGFTRFMRGFTYRSEDELNEWYDETLAKIDEIHSYTREYLDTGDYQKFPRNLTSCTNYGGCEFRKVCKQAPQFRESQLKSNFSRREPWNPLVER